MHNQKGHPVGLSWSDDDRPFLDEVRTLDTFHAVEISGNFELTLKKDIVPNDVVISSPDNVASKIIRVC